MYLPDTDTIIYSLKGHVAIADKLRHHYRDPLCLSVITLMELYYGAYKSENVESNLAKVKTLEGSLKIIRVGEEIVELFGMLKSKLEKKGKTLDDFDLIIAATALSHNLILVTNNIQHFKRINGLNLENWTQSD